jgi:polyisoprenoid-binding protein YceI
MKLRAAAAVVAVSLVAFGTFPERDASGKAETYQVDPDHSFVMYRVRHMGIGYSYGRFNEISGQVVLDDDPAKSSVEVKVNAASIDSANKKRDDHLRNPDFFNCAQFPELTFKSTSIKKADGANYDVTGDLTMHGVTKPVTIRMEMGGPITDPWKKQRIGFDGSVVVQRSQWGIGKVQGNGDDDVRLTIAIEAVK